MSGRRRTDKLELFVVARKQFAFLAGETICQEGIAVFVPGNVHVSADESRQQERDRTGMTNNHESASSISDTLALTQRLRKG